jgi:hypothetical protein
LLKKILLLWLVSRLALFLTVGSQSAWDQGDVHFYLEIASTGYQPGFLSNCGWCPGFPLLLKLIPLNPLLLNNLILLPALIMTWQLNRLDHDEDTAWKGLLLLLAFPSAYFLTAPLSEATFLLFSVSAFWSARKNHWFLAALLAAYATITRIQGLLLLPALLLEKPGKKQALYLALIPLAQLLFALHLQASTGDFWAYFHVQQRLERHISGWHKLATGLDGQHWIGITYAIIALIMLATSWEKLRNSQRFYCLASLFLPFYHSLWVSTGRLMIVLTPLYAQAAQNIPKRLFPWTITALIILQLIAAAFYSLANPYFIY